MSRCSKSSSAPTSRTTGRRARGCRCRSACATTGRTISTTTTTLTTAGFAALDIRASRDITLGAGKDAREVTLGFDAFNVLNHVNYGSFVGTLSSPLFGQPISARAARQLQFSARMKF